MSKVRGTDEPVLPWQRYGPPDQMDPNGGRPPHGALPPHGLPPHDGSAYTPGNQRTSPAVVLLIVAGVSTLVGLFFAIPAVILAILGVVNQRESPARSAKLTRWGWIAYVIGAGLMLLAGVALVVVASYAASGNN